MWKHSYVQCSRTLLRTLLCLKVPRLRPLVLLVKAVFWRRGVRSTSGMIVTEQHPTGQKPILVPLCPPKLPLGLTRDRNQACAMTDQPWGPPSLLYDGCRLIFTGVKRPGRGIDHPPHLAPKLMKEYSYTSTPRSVLHAKFTYERLKLIRVGMNYPNVSAVRK